ncbi:signal peptide peptidase SppA [candidate division WOR-3 bacterium JGI_Cruoil_03_51_56]|uniref:Signal peptide peptidase SppA n=1 Tax=candidate division WOR-3 bacterium JGI_Cruoil_03_51_56 TaxID=1973747 RepID=A0A235BZJ1_UNCW3|nr:MAG: signal peptide peptidase SppA [candidate division WOR-3 bacterium JGI_Cruoil_03_51_56]
MSRAILAVMIISGLLVAIPASFLGLLAFTGSQAGFLSIGSHRSALGYLEIEGTITNSHPFIRQLKKLEKNPLVKGIIIRVNSPGGAVTPAHEIYTEIRRVRDSSLPVVVSMGTIAASGGYYVACPADVIVANPGTLTGSIGVIMEFPIVKSLMDKIGLGVEVVKSDTHKDIGSPFRKMTRQDRRILQNVVTDVYNQFIDIVSTERNIPRDKVRALADGRIFTGRQALKEGLVDTLGTFEDAKQIAANLAGIKGEPHLIKPHRPFRFRIIQLFETAAEELLGWPRFPRLSYIWY